LIVSSRFRLLHGGGDRRSGVSLDLGDAESAEEGREAVDLNFEGQVSMTQGGASATGLGGAASSQLSHAPKVSMCSLLMMKAFDR